MTDPIADAAAQQAQNEPSLLEKAQDEIHDLKEKLEHFIHPEADAAPSSTEPVPEVAASTAGEPHPVESQTTDTSAADAGAPNTDSAAEASVQPASDAEQGNAVATEADVAGVIPSVVAGEVAAAASGSVPTASESASAGEAGNAGTQEAALTVATTLAQDASAEVTHIVGAATSASDSIRTHLANIKSHLSARGFEISLVQDVHNELAAIERLL